MGRVDTEMPTNFLKHDQVEPTGAALQLGEPALELEELDPAALPAIVAERLGVAGDAAVGRRTAQPVRWPRSRARITGGVGLPQASASIGTAAFGLASSCRFVRVIVAMKTSIG
jgi:hypothetical protein